MRTFYLLLVAAAFVMLGTQAHAYPNLNASTGLLAVPTADLVAPGNVVAAVDVLSHNDTTFNGRVIIGVAPFLEIGAGVIGGEDTASGISAKFALPNNIAGFTPAVGLTIINGNAIADGTQVYLVGSRVFTADDIDTGRFVGTVGVNFTDIDTASAFRPFVGGQFSVNDRTEIDGEFVLESGAFSRSIYSVFIRHALNDVWSVQTGITNAVGFTGSADSDYFLGTSYSWGSAAR